MKARVFSVLQRIGRSFMLPIAVLPIAGLFLGIGSSLTSSATISALHLEEILGEGTFLNDFLTILTKVGSAFFNNLPIIFAAAVALGMARKAKEVAVLSAIIAFFVMHTTINGMLTLNGVIIDNQIIGSNVLDGTITSTCGILSLEMGVFGGIIVGLGVSFLHNRFYQIQLPSVLSFFEGERFIPIISTIAFLFVGVLMFYIWPSIQNAIFILGKFVSTSGYFGTFVYGVIKRLLVPFGLHHVFYLPFWQTAIGGSMAVNGVMVHGGQNIFFAQLADPNILHFSSEATKYFTGEFIFMIFGLPGAALAMYHTAKPEAKKAIGSLFLSAALTSILTGITEPIEFSFLFAAPLLFGVQVLLAGSAYMIAHIFNIAIGLTFSGGLIDFITFGVLQGNSKTNWILIIPIGIVYFFLYYFSFKYLIKKFDLKTPGRDSNNKLLIFKKPNLGDNKNIIDKQSQLIIRGLGGRDNFSDLDCCITRLRVTINDNSRLNEGLLKQSGAAAVVTQGNSIQIIYGPKASSIRAKLDEYLLNVPIEYDEYKEEIVYNQSCIELGNVVDGEVMPIESSCDQIFSHKLMGDGVIIKPYHGLIVSPCDGVVTMIYPTKHAVGIKLDNGCELLLHFGIDTVNLNGKGFEILVKLNQRINKGDLILNADLEYVRENATSDQIVLVITKIKDELKIEKNYGEMKRGVTILKIVS
ncbi:glucose PTS transporter subunit IIA [Thomasclavelia sp.]